VTNLFIGQNRIYKVETAELNITGDSRTSLDDIDNFVRQTTRVLASYSTYVGGPQVLILQIQAINSSNQLLPGVYDYVVYYLSGTNLLRQIFPNVASARPAIIKKLASNVNSLNFTYDNVNFTLVRTVTTDITLQENSGVQNRAITISSKSTLRNY